MDKNITNIKKRQILVVDDEPGIVNAVRRELATLPTGAQTYEIETFTSPVEALARAKAQKFDVVLSDYRMPEMDGLAFLKALRGIQPECVPLVLSGQTDFDALVRMINESHIYRFIPKPWSAYFLKSSILQAIKFGEACGENRRLATMLRKSGAVVPTRTDQSNERILIVDSSASVASAVANSLTQAGGLDEIFRVMQLEAQAQEVAAGLQTLNISVAIANTSSQALKLAETESFSCIIADYALSREDGATFLANFAEKQPDCVPLILSAVSDMERLVTALDLAHIYAFVSKPWNDYDLCLAVGQALAWRRLSLENRELAEAARLRNLGSVE